ncbi:MAG: energy transducer TonB [Pyrinomonadaceae bacterium]|nr:energy transducer TonB [Pyrinomonadaceae bacterium]
MRSPSFTTRSKSKKAGLVLFPFFILLFTFAAAAQRVAILTSDNSEQSNAVAESLSEALSTRLKVIDSDLSKAAFNSKKPTDPFNMTADESKRAGAAIGCDQLILIRAANQRRSAFGRAEYYEAYAVIYVVSSRTGRLIHWALHKTEAKVPAAAAKLLNDTTTVIADEIKAKIDVAAKAEVAEAPLSFMEEPPEANSPNAKNFIAPIPFRRIKPEYTADASFYEVTATVELMVDLDATGKILRTEIVRWAGYGLDESVERAVRQMNWRPAERNGKTLPMRFLLRYNFKKVDKEPL